MCQHVSLPTHNSGHILDLIITNALSNLANCSHMLDTYISDHKTVCVDIDLPKPTVNKVTFSYHPINIINFTEFNQDISHAFSNLDNFNFESRIIHYNSNMSSIFDTCAPLKKLHVQSLVYFINFQVKKVKDDNWNKLGVKTVMNQTD